ncbi:hypothetical protein DV735_g1354, partial [Chaetothyriales sp. CBS 134920]
MAGHKRSNQKPPVQRPKILKRKREEEDLATLAQRINDLDAQSLSQLSSFSDLPLSQATQKGLSASHFKTLTAIQARAIPLALKGADVLGAAKTGSGKTLAFLIPVLENLYRKRWTEYDGVGVLILSPTRELAIQIFDVLRKVGRGHSFSAGLVIGGKSLQDERERMGRMNILVATPGRMQQHLDQTAELDVGNLQMLVLDEADRIMDMGFASTVDAIIEHLPRDRQTLLFSATQTKKVSDLARLSLSEPEFVSAHEAADNATPSGLQQNYVVTPLADKLDTLWSFLRANVKKKTIVFLSSGKQVRFVYEAFRHLQPGIPLLHIHGRQRQTARLDITSRFSSSKYACLFATDVAARGLDFPSVDWVVQLDCPEDADTYIHRVGRTARYESEGKAVLFLDPSEEEGMLKALERKKVKVESIKVRPAKMQHSIRTQLQNMCFKDPELKYLGQKAFVSYVRSVYVQKDRDIFDVKKLDLEAFAASLGLPGAPRVKFIKGEDAKARKNMPRQLLAMSSDRESEAEAGQKEVRTKYDRMFERQNQDVLAPHYAKLIDEHEVEPGDEAGADETPDGEGLLSVKRRFEAGDAGLDQRSPAESDDPTTSADESTTGASLKRTKSGQKEVRTIQPGPKQDDKLIVDSNRRAKLLTSKKKLLKFKGHGDHLHFDSDSDTPHEKHYYEDESKFAETDAAAERARRFAEERAKVKERDVEDKEVAKQKRQEKKARRKERERAEIEGEEGEARVELVPFEEAEAPEQQGNDEPEAKRQRKWFEDNSSDDGRKQTKASQARLAIAHEEPATVEDLEAIASGLLRK